MSYYQYRNLGPSLGKILYCLQRIGVPLRIVEEVILENNGNLTYYRKPFCDVRWNGDEPEFTFQSEFRIYQHLQQQYEENIPYVVAAFKATRGVMNVSRHILGKKAAVTNANAAYDLHKQNSSDTGVAFLVLKLENIHLLTTNWFFGKKLVEHQAGSY